MFLIQFVFLLSAEDDNGSSSFSANAGVKIGLADKGHIKIDGLTERRPAIIRPVFAPCQAEMLMTKGGKDIPLQPPGPASAAYSSPACVPSILHTLQRQGRRTARPVFQHVARYVSGPQAAKFNHTCTTYTAIHRCDGKFTCSNHHRIDRITLWVHQLQMIAALALQWHFQA